MTATTGARTLALAALAVVLWTAAVFVQTTGTAGGDPGATIGPAVDPSAVLTIGGNLPPLHAKPMCYPHVTARLPRTERLAERFLLLP